MTENESLFIAIIGTFAFFAICFIKSYLDTKK